VRCAPIAIPQLFFCLSCPFPRLYLRTSSAAFSDESPVRLPTRKRKLNRSPAPPQLSATADLLPPALGALVLRRFRSEVYRRVYERDWDGFWISPCRKTSNYLQRPESALGLETACEQLHAARPRLRDTQKPLHGAVRRLGRCPKLRQDMRDL
jgi:hypothetical protein